MTQPASHVPDLPALRLLVGVARHGSIGGAAREAGVSQQAASERLRAVEAQVGLTLLQRGARGSQLTSAGVVLVEWAGRLLDVADELDTAIDGLRSARGRDLAVHASMTVAESLVPRWLVLLRQRQVADGHRPTAVSLTAGNSRQVVDAVRRGAAHVGFVEGLDVPAGLRSRTVVRDRLVLVAPPGTPLTRRRSPLEPDEVAELALTGREAGSGTREVVEAALARHRLTGAAPALELTTATAVREAVRAGSAPAFLSRRVVERDLAAGQLVEVPVTGLDLERAFRAVWVGSATPPAGPVRDLVAIARSTG
ncbi:molybdate transport repressor ModE-like protein [Nocardioides ginsengisegetis]|uniref:Molybdate transport repressor ModE-like protein n=1 Tax=Nocardioides ginsengisegetis TaxID=661491 RepID=A0A7W3J155_9ACTN|nr:molybdate transport repressor ModE-like protein [Nocardioides ginsengisegetis]